MHKYRHGTQNSLIVQCHATHCWIFMGSAEYVTLRWMPQFSIWYERPGELHASFGLFFPASMLALSSQVSKSLKGKSSRNNCWIANDHFARPQFWPLLQLSLNSIQLDFDPWSIFAYRPNGSLQQDVRPIQPSYRCCIDLGLGSWSSDAQQCSFRRSRQDAMSQHVPTCRNMSQPRAEMPW